MESLKQLPSKEISLHTVDNEYFFFKADILAHTITYSTDKHLIANEHTISARRAFEIIEMNRAGKKPQALTEDGEPVVNESKDLLDQDNITRFDKAKKKKKKPQNRQGNQPGSQPRPSAKDASAEKSSKDTPQENKRQQKMNYKAQSMNLENKKPQNKPKGGKHRPNNVRNSTGEFK